MVYLLVQADMAGRGDMFGRNRVLAGVRIKGQAGKADYSVDVGNCMSMSPWTDAKLSSP
jgi:hypothetical protein